MEFDDKYFIKLSFTKEEIREKLKNALKDLNIAKQDKILEVKFNYAYTAFIKGSIALCGLYKRKIKSVPGHHIKLIEKMAEILKDDAIAAVGNAMRSKRNTDLYDGGIYVTEKECREYLEFVDKILSKIKEIIFA